MTAAVYLLCDPYSLKIYVKMVLLISHIYTVKHQARIPAKARSANRYAYINGLHNSKWALLLLFQSPQPLTAV